MNSENHELWLLVRVIQLGLLDPHVLKMSTYLR